MPWTNLDFYKTKYLMDDTTAQIVPDVSFNRMASRAEDAINRRNMTLPDDFTAPVCLQKCVCAVAELLYKHQQALAGVDTAGEPLVRSVSNKGYSETYFLPQERLANMTQAELNAQVRNITVEYLAGTEMHNYFVYAGVR